MLDVYAAFSLKRGAGRAFANHPAGFVIRLTQLTKATLDHFIFLERPADAEVSISIAEGSPQRGMGMTTPAMTGKHRHEPTYAERGLSQSNG